MRNIVDGIVVDQPDNIILNGVAAHASLGSGCGAKMSFKSVVNTLAACSLLITPALATAQARSAEAQANAPGQAQRTRVLRTKVLAAAPAAAMAGLLIALAASENRRRPVSGQ